MAFCDLIMPEIAGMDVHEYVRGRFPGGEPTLVFMTGGAFTERAQRFLATVPNEVLYKPSSRADVERIIARHSLQGSVRG